MKYLLDTDTCIYIIKRAPEKLYERFRRIPVGNIGVSAITYCELEYGVARSSNPGRNREVLQEFLGPVEVLDFPGEAAMLFGEVRARLMAKGTPIGPYDVLIAVHALHAGCVLVTNNTREFRRVPGLKVENWTS